ncbi:MAG: hypothetical protein RI571_06125 [Roseovarius sp.]|nr:hypothetical protein [Roseovarius sp.]
MWSSSRTLRLIPSGFTFRANVSMMDDMYGAVDEIGTDMSKPST